MSAAFTGEVVIEGKLFLKMNIHISQSEANAKIHVTLLDREKQKPEGIICDRIGCFFNQTGTCAGRTMHIWGAYLSSVQFIAGECVYL